MMGYGLLSGAIVGTVGYFLGLLIKWLVGWILLAGLFLAGLASMVGAIFGFAIIIWFYIGMGIIALGYPGVLGAIIGSVIEGQATKGKCRNPKHALLISSFSGLLGYAAFSLLAIQLTGNLQLTSRMLDPTLGSSSIPGWVNILFWLDTLILVIASGWSAYYPVASNPFCEECEVWYQDSHSKQVAGSTLESIYETLASVSINPLEGLDFSATTDLPYLHLKTKKCPTCESSDIQISGDLFWLDEEIKDGKTVIKERNLTLFSTMISFELGRKIEKLLSDDNAEQEESEEIINNETLQENLESL